MSYKGKFKIKNKEKYLGDSSHIIYRSLWEKRFMTYCDNNPDIISWSSEEIIIPYYSPVDRKMHRYFPDFYTKVRKEKSIEEYIIEVKPLKETKPPRKRKNNQTYLYEMNRYIVNESKWKAAINFCSERGWKFKILTEKTLT